MGRGALGANGAAEQVVGPFDCLRLRAVVLLELLAEMRYLFEGVLVSSVVVGAADLLFGRVR